MGTYSKNYTLDQMRKMGFLLLRDVPKKYRLDHRFYFKFYDAGTNRATAYLNIGKKGLVKRGLKIFKYPSRKYLQAYHLTH